MNKNVSELIYAGFISEKQRESAFQALKMQIPDAEKLSRRLGCLFRTPSRWNLRMAENAANVLPEVLYTGTHPESVTLMDKISQAFPKDGRTASPAEAVTALLEFVCSGGKEKLSADFLYRKCKETDGIPAFGTVLETAFSCAEKYGTCREDLMRSFRAGENSGGPLPAKAVADAQKHRLNSPLWRLERFDDIDLFKDVLNGSGEFRKASPIVVGIDVFKSWYLSPFTQKTGWISLPLPYDERLGGVAMLIVGYRDSKYAAGGGFFIAKSFWEKDFAGESDSPGYAKIPYAYIVNYVSFAGAAISGKEAVSAAGAAVENKRVPSASDDSAESEPETANEDFISQEQYEEAVKSITRKDGDYEPGGKTGCRLDESRRSTKVFSSYTAYRSGGNYPAEASLVPFMPPVYDQGGRGTCAAMAITALAEYYEGCRKKLSQQYLFCKCKEFEYKSFQTELAKLLNTCSPGELYARLDSIFSSFVLRGSSQNVVEKIKTDILALLKDGNQGSKDKVFTLLSANYIALDNTGTTLDIAMTCLNDDGICAYDIWPYQREPVPGNEGQFVSYPDGCAPEDAERDARKHRLRDDFKMIYPPNSVEAYKAILSGANGKRPMPIAIGALTFTSWVNSPFAKKTGWVSMPLPDDKGAGGHAMLVVGYKDAPKVPGGGYFLVRNSWGTGWAFGAPHPGYARMPYKYVEKFVKQAATIIQDQEDAPDPVRGASGADKGIENFVCIAECDMKDGRGIWSISKGDWIIADPETGIAEPDTPQNRARFVKQNFTWAGASGAETVSSHRLAPEIDDAIGVMGDFTMNLDANLRDFGWTYCFPGINLPFAARILPWQLRVKKVKLREDISKQWVEAQYNEKLIAESDRETAKLCNKFLIYELSGSGVLFRVAAIFFSPLDNGKLAENVDNRMIDCAKKLLQNYLNECCRNSSASATFCVLGSSRSFSGKSKAGMSHDVIDIVAQKRGKDFSWEIRFPDVKATPVWFKFITHLLPMSAADRLELVQSTVDRVNATLGTTPLRKIAEESGWPVEMVWPEVVELVRRGGYKYEHGEVRKDEKARPKRFMFSFPSMMGSLAFGLWNNFVAAVFFAIGWKLFVRPDMSNRYQIGTIAGLGLFSYLGSCLSADKLRNVSNVIIGKGDKNGFE